MYVSIMKVKRTMVTRTIERIVKIITIQAIGNRILIQLSTVKLEPNQVSETPQMPWLEDIIVKEPETDEERMAMRIARGYMKELQKFMPSRRHTPHQRPSSITPLRIELTTEEYENLGKPTVNETLVLKLEYKEWYYTTCLFLQDITLTIILNDWREYTIEPISKPYHNIFPIQIIWFWNFQNLTVLILNEI